MSRGIDWTPEQSKLVTDLLRQHLPGVKAWAYGSRARWNARPDSDLDLVVFADRSQKAQVSALSEALEESSLPYKVDLFVWDEVPDNFRLQIEKERVEVSPLAPASSPGAAGSAATPLSGAKPRNAPEWEVTTLGKICLDQSGAIQTGPFGSQLHASDYVDVGVPVVMPVNIGTDGRLHEEGIERIAKEDAERLSQHILRAGDIVFSRRGDVTRCAYVDPEQVGWFCGTGCLKIRLGTEKKATSRFIAYSLKLPESKEWLVRHAVGATMPNLNTTILGNIPCVLPPISVQKSIAHILGTLDDKIELNRCINQTLEKMAQALFKSWFVDFDPVKAKSFALEAGGTPEEAEQAAMQAISGKSPQELENFQRDQPEAFADLTRTASLFPSRLIESEFGPIPEGWRVGCVGDVCQDIFSGGTPTTTEARYWGGGIPWLSSGETGEKFIIKTEKSITPAGVVESSTREAKKYAVVIASAGQGKTRGQTSLLLIDSYVNQSVVVLQSAGGNPYVAIWLFFLLSGRYEEMRGISDSHSSRGSLTTKLVRGMPVSLPPDLLLEEYGRISWESIQEIDRRIQLTRTLISTRDSLLPKLLSGELEIPNELLQAESV